MSETAGNPGATWTVTSETTYQPGDTYEVEPEPAKPIEGDTPLPLDDPADDDEED